MIDRIFGFKLDQTQTYDKDGTRLVVTKILPADCKVLRVKNDEKDGYKAIVISFPNPLFKKKKIILREIKVSDVQAFKKDDVLSVDQIFKIGDKVCVRGKSKGKGFAGVVKRWGFKGGPKTHGQSDRERAPGAIGQRSDPGRVWKGKRMSGRMGGVYKTITGLEVHKILEDKSQLFIKGVVPGYKGQILEIYKQK